MTQPSNQQIGYNTVVIKMLDGFYVQSDFIFNGLVVSKETHGPVMTEPEAVTLRDIVSRVKEIQLGLALQSMMVQKQAEVQNQAAEELREHFTGPGYVPPADKMQKILQWQAKQNGHSRNNPKASR